MGVTQEGGCFPTASSGIHVAHSGWLKYQGKNGQSKERHFAVDARTATLLKCCSVGNSKQRLFRSSVAHVQICDVVPILHRQDGLEASNIGNSEHESDQFEVVTSSKQRVLFAARNEKEANEWVQALQKVCTGFSLGIATRIAARELLAGKYALVRELGRGASGIVSLYTYQGMPFAVKKFIPRKAREMPNRRLTRGPLADSSRPRRRSSMEKPDHILPDEVRREIALLKKASQLPYLIQLHDVIIDKENDSYYIVMDYMGGGPIAEWDAQRKEYTISATQKQTTAELHRSIRRYFAQLVLGLKALHGNQICHRDIKPENLMITEDRKTCKIGDLGVAQYFREKEGVLEEDDELEIEDEVMANTDISTMNSSKKRGMIRSTKGTYQFLPPEALTGESFCGFRADIWAAGVTLYALRFNKLPFFSTDIVQLFEMIEKDELTFPASCSEDALLDLLRKMLEKDPDQRITLEGILDHPWVQQERTVSHEIQTSRRELGAAERIRVQETELLNAVSVLRQRPGSHDEEYLSGDYMPHPINVDGVELTQTLSEDVEILANNMHFEWCNAKHLQGWEYGAERNESSRVHNLLLPFRELKRDDQEKNRATVRETLKCILTLGCRVQPPMKRRNKRYSFPVPIQAQLSWQLLLLVDLLAENSHEVWSLGYLNDGWKHGQMYDVSLKTHPSLRPYAELPEDEKQICRQGITSILQALLSLGYVVSFSRTTVK